MEVTLKAGFLSPRYSELSNPSSALPTRGVSSFHQARFITKRSISASVSRSSSLPESEFSGDVMWMFWKDRQLKGDFVTKISDMLWRKDNSEFADVETNTLKEDNHDEVVESDSNNGFLELTRTRESVSGQSIAPVNKKLVAKNWQNESEKRKKLNLLNYEALKRELSLLTIGVGAACSAYCLVILSFQAAFSYASGVLFSCLYLQLLYHHTDNLSKEAIPEFFLQKKMKKIGIRSEDLKNVLEKTLSGTTIAFSSPRLVIPATIYGLWILSQHFPNDYFDFQVSLLWLYLFYSIYICFCPPTQFPITIGFAQKLVPGMFGFLAYKAAALIQLYRDNEDLHLIFPDDEMENS